MMNPTHGDFTNPFEDPKVRLRHHNSLMRDYRELHMETEATREKLQTMREKKATLMAEVRFLRRRYRHLSQDQPKDFKKVRGGSKGGKKKIRVQVSPNKRSEVETKHVSLPDLNHSGNVHDETKTSLKKKVPLFDLNQISGEEEEETEVVNNNNNNNQERMKMEEYKSMNSCIEMQQQKDLKLSSCRNGGNGSNKRKISWQDLVAALKV